ncbi:MAG: ABC transporter ATP-binding protein [Deltaproteobacteria bacterium]|nr:ABC transporter ATP-binding protein [Deltaproteobacteria bacterium]MBW2266592.1 ABC transporter ATP-binding protein [Deltaproteobacteria bacterium]
MDKNNVIIKLEEISFNYPGHAPVIDRLNLSIHRGDQIGLTGSNGSGKTTLFHIIMGLLKPASGQVEILGKPVRNEKDFKCVRKKVGLLFQDADDQLFSPTVIEDVAFGPLNIGKSQDEAKAIAQKTLQYLGLAGFEDRITYKLSGGEKRLVSLATVLAMEPEVLLLDEPTTGLDEATEKRLVGILEDLEMSYLLVSHDMDFLMETTSYITSLVNGKISWDDALIPHTHVHTHKHGRYSHEHGRE